MPSVTLDAMIKRADFAQETEDKSMQLFRTMRLSDLYAHEPTVKMLRKPDFQRETNHWTPHQVATFIDSFTKGELIPSLILWKSNSLIFVIDGAHRLSALRSWVENDYGDGNVSNTFYDHDLSKAQKKIADQTRKLVENSVGRFSDLKGRYNDDVEIPEDQQELLSRIFTRSIDVQWIQGSQQVAESSFFKINTQGTPLDKTEELLLRYRHTSYAIAARAIVRAGAGHKYWSKFNEDRQTEIEEKAKALYEGLFQPDLDQPIKTMDLPVGGTVSPVNALRMLLDVFAAVENKTDIVAHLKNLEADRDGIETSKVLDSALKLVRRVTTTSHGSLGLHPAVYFYDHKGRHSRHLFLGTLSLIAKAIRNNDKTFFIKFSSARKNLEAMLVDKKFAIGLALTNVNSKTRVEKFSSLINEAIKAYTKGDKFGDKQILSALGLQGEIASISSIKRPKSFSTATKSAIFLKQSLQAAAKCPVCNGLLDPAKAASYDHILPQRDGGTGAIENGQITHPFCNTGIKN